MTKDTIDIMISTEAGKLANALNDTLECPKLDCDQIRMIVRNITVIEGIKDAEAFLRVVDGIEEKGIAPYDSPQFMREFNRFVALQTIKLRDKQPNLSGIGLSRFPIQSQRYPDWFLAPDWCIQGIEMGGTGIVWGVPRSGKTDFTVHKIILPALKKGIRVVSNINLNDCKYENYKYSSFLSDTLLSICENAIAGCEMNGKPHLTMKIFDDPVIKRLKAQAMQKKNIELKQITHIFRKFGGFEWLLPQRKQDTPSEVIDFNTHAIKKADVRHPDRANAYIDLGKVKLSSIKVFGVKGLEQRKELGMEYLDFKTYQISDMNVDVPLVPMLNNMWDVMGSKAITEIEIEQYKAIMNFIKRYKGKGVHLDDEQIADVLALIFNNVKNDTKLSDELKMKKMSCRILGALVGWKRGKTYEKLKVRDCYPLN